jgi:hypothetical protein
MGRLGVVVKKQRTAALAAFCALVACPASASATVPGGDPFAIGAFPTLPNYVTLPSVAVDPNGTAYVVWADPVNNVIDYCMLPDGATACAASGTLAPETSVPTYVSKFGLNAKVLINDGTVSVLGATNVSDPTANDPSVPVEMWQAPDGTANFTLVNGGSSVANPDGRVVPQSVPLMGDGVVVPGTNQLGVTFNFYHSPPTFEAFSQVSPPGCSSASGPLCPFATLEPSSNPDPVSNYGGGQFFTQLASSSGATPGVLALYHTSYSTGPFGCTTNPPGSYSGAPFTYVYAYGSGIQSPTNDYNISPGSPNSAWRVAATVVPGECPINEATIAGGPSGVGLLESITTGASQDRMQYRPFDAATGAWDLPAVTVDPNAYTSSVALSQDGSSGLYATGFASNAGGGSSPLALFYSPDGGKTWQGPSPLEPDVQPDFHRAINAVGADGKGWLVTTAGNTVYALEFSAANLSNSFSATVGAVGPVPTTGTVAVPVSCYTVPCAVDATLVNGASSNDAAAASTLGTGMVEITQHGRHNLVIALTPSARRKLAGAPLHAVLSESTVTGAYEQQRTIHVTIKAKHAKRRPKHHRRPRGHKR